MPSDKNKRAQRHQTQLKQNLSNPTKRSKMTEKVAGSGYREVQYIGNKKYYVPLSDDPNKSITGTSAVETETTSTGSNLISSHGSLSGLTDDDHLQYIKHDGARAFTGNQSFGGNNITTVGDLDVNGHTTLDRTSIDTTDGILAVTGTNNIEATPTANITLQAQGATDAPKNVSAIGGKSDFTKYGGVLLESYNKTTESGSSDGSNYGANGVHIVADSQGNTGGKHNNIFIEQKNTNAKGNSVGIDLKSSNGIKIRSIDNATSQPTQIAMYSSSHINIKGGTDTKPSSDTNVGRTWIHGVCQLDTLYRPSGQIATDIDIAANPSATSQDNYVQFEAINTPKLMRNYTYIAKNTGVNNGATFEIVPSTKLENTIGTMYMVTVAIKQNSNEWQNVAMCSRIATTTWLITTLGQSSNIADTSYGTISADSGGSATGIIWTNNIGSTVSVYATAQRIAEASHYP